MRTRNPGVVALFAALLAVLILAPRARAVWTPEPLGDDNGKPLDGTAIGTDVLSCLILPGDDCMGRADAAKMLTSDARSVPLAPATFGVHPNFERLFSAYPNGTLDEVKALIGRASEGWIVNTCAIRISYAMNFSGIGDFKIDPTFTGTAKPINFITDKSRPAKNAVYIYRVDELAAYLLKKYGRPQVWGKKGSDNLKAKVWGKKGVILFVVGGWQDATGHFDLWDGQQVAHEEFFDKASDVFLWQ